MEKQLPCIPNKEAKKFLSKDQNKADYKVIYMTVERYYKAWVNGESQYMIR